MVQTPRSFVHGGRPGCGVNRLQATGRAFHMVQSCCASGPRILTRDGIHDGCMLFVHLPAEVITLGFVGACDHDGRMQIRSEEHTSELQSLMRISYAVFCLKKKKTKKNPHNY